MADDTLEQAPDPRHELIHQGAVASLLSGLNAPQPAAPQYVPPVVANTGKWEKIITGAMAGLGGGLKAGLQNIQDAGTPRGPHASGYAEGEAMQQQMAAQDQAQKDRATAQAQQDFSNKIETGKYTQEQQLNRARTMSANLSAYHLAQAIDSAPQEHQDAYYKEQNGRDADYQKAGMSALAEVPDTTSLAGWMKQNGKTAGDIVTTHHKDDNGNDRIKVWESPSHQVDSGTINKSLAAYGYPAVPDGVTMNAADAHALIGKAQSAHATNLNAQNLQSQKDAASMARTQATQAGENARESRREAAAKDKSGNGVGAEGSDDWTGKVRNAADQMKNGKQTWEQVTKGMGTRQSDFNRDLTNLLANDPSYAEVRPAVLSAYEAHARNPAIAGQIAMARTLFGGKDAEGKSNPGTFDQLEELIKQVPDTGPNIISRFTQPAQFAAGQQALSRIHRLGNDVAQDVATFQTGAGGRQTDSKTEMALHQLQTADTKENLRKGFQDLRDASEHRLHGIVGKNPYLANMAQDINPPSQRDQPHTATGHKAGDTVSVKGKPVKIKTVYPDGSFDPE